MIHGEIGPPEDRTQRGFSDCGIVTIRCEDCGQKLLDIQITMTNATLKSMGNNEIKTNIACHCGICGGISVVCSIEGTFAPGVAEDSLCMDFVCEKDNIHVFRVWRK
jgi:hypothetical protein